MSINAGEMPPEKKKQASNEEKAEFLDDLSETMVLARKALSDSGGKITMRRLNRREYQNTIKELTDEKDDLLTKLKSKESRIKQVLVQLEQSVDDVSHCGKKIREQELQIKELTEEVKDLRKKTEHEEEPKDDQTEIQQEEPQN